MPSSPPDDLMQRLAHRLAKPLPGRAALRAAAPRLTYGRHAGPPAADAREAAVLVVMLWSGKEWVVPLIRRRHDMAAHAGQIGLPGGAVEPGETSREAALREAQEELDLDPAAVEVAGSLTPLYVFGSKFDVTPWLGVCTTPQLLTPNPAEVAELLLPTLEELLNPDAWVLGAQRQRGLGFAAPHMEYRGHEVWGATCMILSEVRELMREL